MKMTKRTVLVETTDIAGGNQLGLHTCPVANALKRIIDVDFLVGGSVIVFHPCRSNELTIQIPAGVKKKIETYDETGKMKPFKFSMELPADYCVQAVKLNGKS